MSRRASFLVKTLDVGGVDGQIGSQNLDRDFAIEPRIVGPFADADERDRKARELRREHGQDHGIYMLDVDPRSGAPSIDAYCGGFFMEEDEE